MNRSAALVTGASRGIGRAIAVALAREGLAVGLLARQRAKLEETARLVREAGGEASVLEGDVTDEAALERAVAAMREWVGGLDVLVNNAGIAVIGPIERFAAEDFRRTLEVNVLAPFVATKAALPLLKASGRALVVNVGSICSTDVFPEWSAYCASKHALLAFSRTLREEVREHGIRVTDVLPGTTATDIFDGLPGDWPKERMIAPEVIGEAVAAAWRAPANATFEILRIAPTAGSV